MSDLILIHHAFQSTTSDDVQNLLSDVLIWETCRRKIYFTEFDAFQSDSISSESEIYFGLDAEEFLIQILCGLKSPLIGETEVFGQFKLWWEKLPDQNYKSKFNPMIQQIYSIVKKTRDQNLCGLGAQSYGSLLRKKVSAISTEPFTIDFLGSGQLVEEMIPWLEKKWNYRIWSRSPEKVKDKGRVISMQNPGELSKVLVVAAPLTHDELSRWMAERKPDGELHVFDFRKDSMSYVKPDFVHSTLNLDDFTFGVESQRHEISRQIANAFSFISNWKEQAASRMQVRPFGWDDL